jgi:hypothetical protein
VVSPDVVPALALVQACDGPRAGVFAGHSNDAPVPRRGPC